MFNHNEITKTVLEEFQTLKTYFGNNPEVFIFVAVGLIGIIVMIEWLRYLLSQIDFDSAHKKLNEMPFWKGLISVIGMLGIVALIDFFDNLFKIHTVKRISAMPLWWGLIGPWSLIKIMKGRVYLFGLLLILWAISFLMEPTFRIGFIVSLGAICHILFLKHHRRAYPNYLS